MSGFEYRAIAAPRRGKSGKGVRGGPEKFANAVTLLINEMGRKGWEYLRADTLPCDERQGLTSRVTKYHSLLIFRRLNKDSADAVLPAMIEDLSDYIDEEDFDETVTDETNLTEDDEVLSELYAEAATENGADADASEQSEKPSS